MYNPETSATLSTQGTGRRQTKANTKTKHTTNDNKTMSNMDLTHKRGVNAGDLERQAVPASYKTSIVNIYKSGLV